MNIEALKALPQVAVGVLGESPTLAALIIKAGGFSVAQAGAAVWVGGREINVSSPEALATIDAASPEIGTVLRSRLQPEETVRGTGTGPAPQGPSLLQQAHQAHVAAVAATKRAAQDRRDGKTDDVGFAGQDKWEGL